MPTHTFPKIKVTLSSFDMVPRDDRLMADYVHFTLRGMKGTRKANIARALNNCDALKVARSEKKIVVSFVDTSAAKEKNIQFRIAFELMQSFGGY